MYNIYLDNVLLESTPKGLEQFSFEIKREIPLRRMTLQYPTNLTFYGDGFNILYDAIQRDGYNKTFDVVINKISPNQETARTIYGIIFLIDVEFDLTRRTATAQVKENGYLAKIWNNEDNPIVFPCYTTKNGESIDVSNQQMFQLSFDYIPAIGAVLPFNQGQRYGINVVDALKIMVANMSDNDVEMESIFFDNLLQRYNATRDAYIAPIMLIRGKELRLGGERESNDDFTIKTTFKKLSTAISHIYNLYLYQNTKQQPPLLKLEHESLFYGSEVQTEMDLPENTTMSFFQDLFYSTARVGSSNTTFKSGETAYNVPNISFVSFKQDDFTIDGKSNINSPYEIAIDQFVVDSNIIRDVLLNNNDSYDDEIFMIQYRPDELDAVSFKILNENAFNGGLTPDKYVNWHNMFGRITQNLTTIETDGRFQVRQDEQDFESYVMFKDVPPTSNTYNIKPSYHVTSFDYTDGQWDDQTYTFTPLSSGMYTFKVIHLTAIKKLRDYGVTEGIFTGGVTIEPTNDRLNATMSMQVLSSGEIVSEQTIFQETYKSIGVYGIPREFSIYLNANEVVQLNVKYSANGNGGTLNYNIEFDSGGFGSLFECTSSPNISLIYGNNNVGNAYRGTRLNLEYNLNQKQIQNILDEPQNSIEIINFVNEGKSKPCWISNMTINFDSGQMIAELITNFEPIETQQIENQNMARRINPTGCDVGILCFENINNSQYLGAL